MTDASSSCCDIRRGRWQGLVALLSVSLLPSQALAHASDRGHVLLLPTGHYLVGGALAVVASFFALLLLPATAPAAPVFVSTGNARVAETARAGLSLLSCAVLVVLVLAGFYGSRDPLSNPLPLTVWTLLWVGLTLVQGLLGFACARINPWYGQCRIVAWLLGRATAGPLVKLPHWLGYWPAVLLFLAFAWFELIYPAPDDPARLGMAVGGYWLFSFAAMIVFSYQDWTRRGEFLSVFFAMLSRFGIVWSTRSDDGTPRLGLGLPGAKLAATPPLPLGGTAFLLLALASVSFDGLSKTFSWLGLNGINPLEFPGRTAMIGINSLGLLAMFAVLSSAFFLSVLAGERLAGNSRGVIGASGLLVWSIVPIALAYHFSHYLTVLLVNGQYAMVALSDPFSLGWNLFGTAYLTVNAGIVMGSQSAWMIWNLQAVAIVGGHVVAVLAAHRLAFRLHPTRRAALLSQLPLTLLMIGYTVFGLWLLSTPTAG